MHSINKVSDDAMNSGTASVKYGNARSVGSRKTQVLWKCTNRHLRDVHNINVSVTMQNRKA